MLVENPEGEKQLGRQRCNWEDNTERNTKIIWERGLNYFGSERTEATSREHDIKTSISTQKKFG